MATPRMIAHVLTGKFVDSLKFYMWVFRGGPPGRIAFLYQYHPTRSGNAAQNFLKGYQGVVQTDGYTGYNFLDHASDIYHIGCLAHVRRKFTDVTRAAGKLREKGKKTRAC